MAGSFKVGAISLFFLSFIFSHEQKASNQIKRGDNVIYGVVKRKWVPELLSGVRVELLGTNLIATTESYGAFHFQNVPRKPYAIRFSFPLFDTLTLSSAGSFGRDTLTVELPCTPCKGLRERAMRDTTNATLVHILTGGFVNPDSALREEIARLTHPFGYETWYGGCDQTCS